MHILHSSFQHQSTQADTAATWCVSEPETILHCWLYCEALAYWRRLDWFSLGDACYLCVLGSRAEKWFMLTWRKAWAEFVPFWHLWLVRHSSIIWFTASIERHCGLELLSCFVCSLFLGMDEWMWTLLEGMGMRSTSSCSTFALLKGPQQPPVTTKPPQTKA